MKYLLILSFLILPSLAIAQEEGAHPITECAAVLAAPPIVDILTRNEGRDFLQIAFMEGREVLLGLECGVDELTEFFEKSGWGFEGFEESRPLGPLGARLGIPEYYSDSSASYCIKRPTIFGILRYRCRARVRVLFYEGRISHLIANVSK